MAAFTDTPMHQDSYQAYVNHYAVRVIIGLFAALTLALGALIARQFQPPLPPYVLVTKADGTPMARLLPLVGTAEVPDEVTRWFLSDFIDNAFTIESNFDEEAQVRLPKVYLMMPKQSQAAKALTDWYKADKNANNPIVQYTKGWKSVHVSRTLRLPATDTYEVHFTTTWHSTADQGAVITNWRAILHTTMGQPTQANELGLWVDYIDLREQE